MKSIISILVALAFVLSLFTGCAGEGAENPLVTGDTTSESHGEYSDPFSEGDYKSYPTASLFGSVDDVEAVAAHEKDGAVYHIVYEQTISPPALTETCIYRYPAFPAYTNEEDEATAWFRGSQALYLFDNATNDLPLPSEDQLVNVKDPGAYGLMEDYVFPLTYEAGDYQPSQPMHTVIFLIADRNGGETTYTVYRDGTVTRNHEQIASEKLSQPVTDCLFAIKYAYAYSAMTHMTYADATNDFQDSPKFGGTIRVRLSLDGEERELSTQESQDFLALVSDTPREEDRFCDYSFRCFVRTNCGAGDHGDEVLRFTLMRYYRDGEPDQLMTYTLFSDGKVVGKLDYKMEYSGDVSTLDRLIIDRYVVSKTNFDVQSVQDYLTA